MLNLQALTNLPSGVSASITDTAKILNWIDEDVNNTLTLVINDTSVTENELNTAFELEFDLVSGPDLTIEYTINGSAVNGNDYHTLTGTVLMPSGSTNVAYVYLTPIDDSLVEDDTTISFTINAVTGFSENYINIDFVGSPAQIDFIDDDIDIFRVNFVAEAAIVREEGPITTTLRLDFRWRVGNRLYCTIENPR